MTDTSTLPQVPIEFTNDDLNAQKPTYAKLRGDMWAEFEIQSAKPDAWASGDYAINMRVAPVTSDGTIAQPHGFVKVTIPVRNPNVVGHVAPRNWSATAFLRAIGDGDLPDTPRKQTDGSYLSDDGEVYTKREASGLFETRDMYVGKTAVALFNAVNSGNEEVLLGKRFYARTDGTAWRNLKNLQAEEPEDEPVERENFGE